MYKIAWLQFVIKIFCQEMHQLQKLDRCEDSVELLGLFESSDSSQECVIYIVSSETKSIKTCFIFL
jgi:hypothetical protein